MKVWHDRFFMNADFSDEIDRLLDLLNAEADECQKERETDKAHQTHQQELIEEEIRNGAELGRTSPVQMRSQP